MLPLIGYQERGELERDQDRKKFGLAPKERMRDRDDPAGLRDQRLAGRRRLDRLRGDGVAPSPTRSRSRPATCRREWIENGRRYFHYKMDVPILNFYAFLSARYAVKKDVWQDLRATWRSRSTTTRATSTTSTR